MKMNEANAYLLALVTLVLLSTAGCPKQGQQAAKEPEAAAEPKPKPIETFDQAHAQLHVSYYEGLPNVYQAAYGGGAYLMTEGKVWYIRGSEAVRVVLPERISTLWNSIDGFYAASGKGLWLLEGARATRVREVSKLSTNASTTIALSDSDKRVLVSLRDIYKEMEGIQDSVDSLP